MLPWAVSFSILHRPIRRSGREAPACAPAMVRNVMEECVASTGGMLFSQMLRDSPIIM